MLHSIAILYFTAAQQQAFGLSRVLKKSFRISVGF
jgi:hypothetical protein